MEFAVYQYHPELSGEANILLCLQDVPKLAYNNLTVDSTAKNKNIFLYKHGAANA